MGPQTQKLIDWLKTWCAQERGRQTEVAALLSTNRQTVNRWFRGIQAPTSEQILTLADFHKTKRPKLRTRSRRRASV